MQLSMFHVKHLINRIRAVQIWELFFYLFVFSIPFQLRTILNPDQAYIDYYFSYHKAIFFYLSDLLFLGVIISLLIKRGLKLSFSYFLLPILWALVSLFHVEQSGLALYGIFKVTQFWLIVWILKDNPSLKESTIRILIVSALLQSALALEQFHVKHGLGLWFLGEYLPNISDSGAATINLGEKILRAYGTFPHPNVLGGFLAVGLAMFLYVSRGTKLSITKGFAVAVLLSVVVCGLLVSYSRSAWLAVLSVSIIFLLAQYATKPFKQAIIWGLIMLTSAVFSIGIYRDTVIPRTKEIEDNRSAFDYRKEFNANAVAVLKEGPLIGTGVNNYTIRAQEMFHVEPWAYQPPHNIFLLYLAENGIIGVLILLFVFLKLRFTWNMMTGFAIILFLILGSLDHYFLTIQQGLLTSAILLGLIQKE